MELPQNDPALERFEELRIREVRDGYVLSAAALLAHFQSTAASLEPDERIQLVVYVREGVESIKAILSDPQANKICALKWRYEGKEDVNSIIPLLINSCPELASLNVYFEHRFEFDFVSSMLEHPSNKLKVLHLPPNTKGDLPRLFAALGQSQVSALTLYYSPEFAQGFYEYLAKDLLVRLKVCKGSEQILLEMMTSLSKCTRLAKLEMSYFVFSQSTVLVHFPKSVTKLELENSTFVGGFDWSFLAGSNVQELCLYDVSGVGGNQLGDALTAHLRAKGLDRLRFSTVSFTNEILAAVGFELGRIKRLDLGYNNLNDASVEQIALALKSPNNEMKELRLTYNDHTASSIEDHLVSALKHPNCNLAKLSFDQIGGGARPRAVEDMFHKRRALLALLQGQQVKRRYCPLRRLPVDLFRLAGKMLM